MPLDGRGVVETLRRVFDLDRRMVSGLVPGCRRGLLPATRGPARFPPEPRWNHPSVPGHASRPDMTPVARGLQRHREAPGSSGLPSSTGERACNAAADGSDRGPAGQATAGPRGLRRAESHAPAPGPRPSRPTPAPPHVTPACATRPTRPGSAPPSRRARLHLPRARRHRVRDPPILARIRALAIPPAWTDVWICPDPNGHLQATGRDARGRKQYRYHARGAAGATTTSSIG